MQLLKNKPRTAVTAGRGLYNMGVLGGGGDVWRDNIEKYVRIDVKTIVTCENKRS
jgi:hypothetical protein